MKILTYATVALFASVSVTSVAVAKPSRHRATLTSAQVESAKVKMERDGTASVAGTTSGPARRACNNISCLGYTTLLGVGY